MNSERLLDWTAQHAAAFRRRAVVARHRLHESNLFSDAELIDVFDNHPRDRLQAFTMGTDPSSILQWQPVDVGGISGKDMLAAIARGRLWFHLFRMENVNSQYEQLQKTLFSELTKICPAFKPLNPSSTLIVASPAALVYYHADPQFNLLWHVRGTKRVWSYPANDRRLIDQEMLEDIFASCADEELPFKPEFDLKAEVYDLAPGDVISWPLNAPHRVTNLTGINVSLSTVYETEESYRRKLVYCANRFFRRSCGIPLRSINENGFCSQTKRLAFRLLQKAGAVVPPRRRAYVTQLRIDPSAPNGIQGISDGPVLTEFSKSEFMLKKNATGEVAVMPFQER